MAVEGEVSNQFWISAQDVEGRKQVIQATDAL
jgi:hypothetical protein